MIQAGNKAIAVAAITALAGFGTAVINRVAPAEPAAELSYKLVKDAVGTVADDIDKLEGRLRAAERELLILKYTNHALVEKTPPAKREGLRRAVDTERAAKRAERKRKRRSLRSRVKMPAYSNMQQQSH